MKLIETVEVFALYIAVICMLVAGLQFYFFKANIYFLTILAVGMASIMLFIACAVITTPI